MNFLRMEEERFKIFKNLNSIIHFFVVATWRAASQYSLQYKIAIVNRTLQIVNRTS